MIKSFFGRFICTLLLWFMFQVPVMAEGLTNSAHPLSQPISFKTNFGSTSQDSRIEVVSLRSGVLPGVVVGGHYDGLLKILQERYTAVGEMNEQLEDAARSLMEEELIEAGYDVVRSSANSLFADQLVDEIEPGRFLLGGTMTQVKLNSYSTLFHDQTQDERAIRWELFDRATAKVVYRQETIGKAEAEGVDNPAATYEAIRSSFRSLLADAGFRSVMNEPTLAALPQTKPIHFEIAALASSDIPLSTEQIVTRSIPSIVQIRTSDGRGSGFVIDSSGLIVTNRHVVGSAYAVKADLYDGSTHPARVIKRDAALDVALLQIEGSPMELPGLPICHTSAVKVGEGVVAIGNPLALSNSVTQGVVSGIRKNGVHHLIQTDAAVNPGNSGGPLLNQRGAVIGIVTEKITSRGVEGLGFALPISESLEHLNIKVNSPHPVLDACGNPTMLAAN
ncbi:MAG TPA: trypsin-like peptidase domain-containing protein [Trichocoleus sp.]|jgi:S1-C subfamily serine protease